MIRASGWAFKKLPVCPKPSVHNRSAAGVKINTVVPTREFPLHLFAGVSVSAAVAVVEVDGACPGCGRS